MYILLILPRRLPIQVDGDEGVEDVRNPCGDEGAHGAVDGERGGDGHK